MTAFSRAVESSQAHYFDAEYGHEYFFLQILATKPQHQRHGAGSRLVKWGLDIAQKRNMKLGLMASPMGRRLYTRLGFRHLDSVEVKAESEEELVTLGIMVFEPRCRRPLAGNEESKDITQRSA